MSIVEKLKKMIRSKGGDTTGVMTIADGVDRLEKTDAGSGNSDVMVIHMNGYYNYYNGEEPDLELGDPDKTPSEALSAIESGKVVTIVLHHYENEEFIAIRYWNLVAFCHDVDDNDGEYYYADWTDDHGGGIVSTIRARSDVDSWIALTEH